MELQTARLSRRAVSIFLSDRFGQATLRFRIGGCSSEAGEARGLSSTPVISRVPRS
jgi:hypothetical protein